MPARHCRDENGQRDSYRPYVESPGKSSNVNLIISRPGMSWKKEAWFWKTLKILEHGMWFRHLSRCSNSAWPITVEWNELSNKFTVKAWTQLLVTQ